MDKILSFAMLGSNDFKKSSKFYDNIFEPLKIKKIVITENYVGYGEVGGKDYYELLAEMNGLPSEREDGISLAFNKNEPHFAPQLVRNINHKWQDIKPKDHEGQGFWSTEEEYA